MRNQKYFILFLFYLVIGECFVLYNYLLFIIIHLSDFRLFKQNYSLPYRIFLPINFIINICCIGFGLYLLKDQFEGLETDTTYVESLKGKNEKNVY